MILDTSFQTIGATTPQKKVYAVQLVPRLAEEARGCFRVWITYSGNFDLGSDGQGADGEHQGNSVLLWDRKKQGSFPELKELVGEAIQRQVVDQCDLLTSLVDPWQKRLIREALAQMDRA